MVQRRSLRNQGVPLPLASVCHYSDPEQFEVDYHAADVELTPIDREPFEAHVARSELDNLWMVQVDDALPRINNPMPISSLHLVPD